MSGRASSSRPGPADIRGKRADDSLLVIERAQLVLNSIGVPDVCFEAKSYLSNGMNPKAFANLLRAVPDFEDPEKVEKILLIGVKRNLFGGIHNLRPRAFYDFLEFLKGPEGEDEIAKLHLTEELAKRGGGHFDVKQMALVSMFEAQRDDCLAELNDVKREYDGRIVNLEMQLRKLQAERHAAVLALAKKYKPYSEMKFLSGREFNIACWKEYLKDCRIERKRARKLETGSLDEAVKAEEDYGSDSSEQIEGLEDGGVFDQVIPSSAERGFWAEAQPDVVPPDGDVDVQQGPDEEQQPIAGGSVGRRSRSSRHPSRA